MTAKKTEDKKPKQTGDDLIASPAEPVIVHTARAPFDEALPAAPVTTMSTAPSVDPVPDEPEPKKSSTPRPKRSSK